MDSNHVQGANDQCGRDHPDYQAQLDQSKDIKDSVQEPENGDLSDDKSPENLFQTLPDEVVTTIFSLLPQRDRLAFSLTCSHFNKIFLTPWAWTKLSINISAVSLLEGTQALFLFLGGLRELREVSFYYRSTINFTRFKKILVTIASASTKLTHLNLSRCSDHYIVNNIFDEVKQVVTSCSGLDHLSLPTSDWFNNQFEALLEAAAGSLQRLTFGIHRVNNTVIEKIICQRVPRLTELVLDTTTRNLNDTVLTAVAQRFGGQLRVLEFHNTQLFTDEGVVELARMCPSLVSVVLRSRYITDEAVAAVAANCPQLARLDLGSCRYLTDRTVAAISQGLPRLTEVNLSCCQVTVEGVAVLLTQLPRLRRLNLASCVGLDERLLRQLSVGSHVELETEGHVICGGKLVERKDQNRTQ